jgi:hypothetical protein
MSPTRALDPGRYSNNIPVETWEKKHAPFESQHKWTQTDNILTMTSNRNFFLTFLSTKRPSIRSFRPPLSDNQTNELQMHPHHVLTSREQPRPSLLGVIQTALYKTNTPTLSIQLHNQAAHLASSAQFFPVWFSVFFLPDIGHHSANNNGSEAFYSEVRTTRLSRGR